MQRSTLLTIAGILTVFAAIIMIYYGLGGLSNYISSLNYYHPVFNEPLLYIGLWNSCTFPFTLAGGILLLKKRHIHLSIIGMVLASVSGFVPLVVFAVIPGYATNGLEFGAPLIFLSIVSFALLAISKR